MDKEKKGIITVSFWYAVSTVLQTLVLFGIIGIAVIPVATVAYFIEGVVSKTIWVGIIILMEVFVAAFVAHIILDKMFKKMSPQDTQK